MADVVLLKSGVGMESGTVSEWRVADGDTVSAGEVIGVLETEKVDVDLEAPAAGVIRLRVEEGQEYPVGTVLATVEEGP